MDAKWFCRSLNSLTQTDVDCDSLTSMAIKSKLKDWLNRGLALADLRLETRSAERAEIDRLLMLEQTGHFRRRSSPLPANCSMRPETSA